ncbi:MAG: glycine--tRNA ligase, partial [Patescibacteria group bacterium]|nr:glycine--tRNA ligase [Patescibacteria group bacterium]
LLANKPELTALADKVFKALKPQVNGLVVWDDRGNIGKRYLSQDEVGTPFCITVDFQSLEDNMVTVRDRDSATQERVAIDELVGYVTSRI